MDAQVSNLQICPILGTYINIEVISFPTWEQEVEYAIHYIQHRFEWMDSYISSL